MITIICSNYNSMKWINGYLDCINNQTLDKFDVCFIDAGSTDSSWEKIKQYNFRDGISCSFLLEKKCTVYEAWNIGFKNAKTQYCMNFNTDDRLFKDSLKILHTYIDKYPEIDVFYSPCLVTKKEDHSNYCEVYDWPEFSKDQLLKECLCGPFPLVKRSAAIDAGLFNPAFTISGDYEMWLRMDSKNKSFLKIKEPLGSYYFNPKGISTNPSGHIEHLKQDTKIREMYKKVLSEKISDFFKIFKK